MNKEKLDHIVDCHISLSRADKNYSVNLFGLDWNEKEYILSRFKEKTGMISETEELKKNETYYE